MLFDLSQDIQDPRFKSFHKTLHDRDQGPLVS